MLLRNIKKTNGNIFAQFENFKSELSKSGKNPQQILNELLSSGQITKEQLDNATNMAKMFSHLIK